MEAEDLFVLHAALPSLVDALAPVGEALVQVGPCALQQAAVGRVADQDVGESIQPGVLVAAVARADELLRRERVEPRLDLDSNCLRYELSHRVPGELEADDRGDVDDGALLGPQAVETGGQQRVDRRRDRQVGDVGCDPPAVVLAPEHTVVDEHRQHLLHVERIAFGRLGDPPADGIVDA